MLLNSDLNMFQQRFETHLGEMVSTDEIGAFILVLANSMSYPVHPGVVSIPSWPPHAGWFELRGGFYLIRYQHFSSLSSNEIEAGLSALKL